MIRLHGEYILGYLRMIATAPLSVGDRLRCLGALTGWLTAHLRPGARSRQLASHDPAVRARAEAARRRTS